MKTTGSWIGALVLGAVMAVSIAGQALALRELTDPGYHPLVR